MIFRYIPDAVEISNKGELKIRRGDFFLDDKQIDLEILGIYESSMLVCRFKYTS